MMWIGRLENFLGNSTNSPQFSAVKVGGQRAYALARKDVSAPLLSRTIEIFDLSVDYFTPPDVALRVHCSKGTYVRALARDLGTC